MQVFLSAIAHASYAPFNTTAAGNIGVGTFTPQAKFVVVSGNVGIGTWTAAGGALMVQGGNVGIGTQNATQALTVAGTIYGASATLANNVGIGTSLPTGALEVEGGNVGIGTAFTTSSRLTVIGGNVGIGTWTPQALLDISTGNGTGPLFLVGAAPSSEYIQNDLEVDGSAYLLDATIGSLTITQGVNLTSGTTTGNVGIGTALANSNLSVNGTVGIGTGNASAYMGITGPSGGLIVQNNVGIGTFNPFGGNLIVNGGGNVGISSLTPGQKLDVVGTVRMTGFALTTGYTNDYVLTSDNNGNGTWQPAPTALDYWLNDSGNVGINTTYNVGIGTSSQNNALNVLGNLGIGKTTSSNYLLKPAPIGGIIAEGNVGFGTWAPTGALEVEGGNVGIGTALTTASRLSVIGGNVGIGTWTPQALLDISTGGGAGPLFLVGAAPSSEYIQNDLEVDGTAYLVEATIGSLSVTQGVTLSSGTTTGNVGIGTALANSNLSVNGTVGIGTGNASAYMGITGPSGGLIVQNNVGIGTFNPFGGKLIVSGGNVGIGSLSPGQALDVVGTARMTGFALTTGYSNGYVLTTDNSGNGTWAAPSVSVNYWLNDSGNVGINTTYNVGIGTSSQNNALNVLGNIGISKTSSSNYLLKPAPNGGIIAEGNVGFGTWAPTGALEVEGGNVGIGTAMTTASRFSVIGGNVGIGTWTPQALLDISTGGGAGPLFLVGAAPSSEYIQNDLEVDGTAYLVGATIGSLTVTQGINLSSGTTTGNVGIGTALANSNLSVNGTVGIGTGNASAYMGITGPSGGLIVQNNVGIGTFNPFGGKLIVSGGNVGIGSLSPGQALDVVGTARMTGFALTTGYSNGYVLTTDNSGNGTWAAPSVSVNYWLNDSGNVGINTTYNVGIGTSSQNNALNVLGNLGIGKTSSSNYLLKPAPNGGIIAEGNVGFGTWAPTGALEVEGGNVGIGTAMTTASRLSVIGGNVGIGTWTPQALLDISTGGGVGPLFLVGAAPSSEYIQNDLEVDGTAYLVGATIGSLTVTQGINLSSGTTTGNVGIGTALANSNLSVNGTVGIGTGNASAYMGITGPSGGLIVQNNVGIGTFNPFGGNLIVNGGGNVGISSLTPGQKLDVVGTVRMTGFALTTGYSNGYVLTTDNNGNGTWAAPSVSVNYWLNDSGNVGINTTYNVGIGTSSQNNALNVLGNLGIGKTSSSNYLLKPAPNGGIIAEGNVGFGTWAPTGALEVEGGNVGIGTAMTTASRLSVIGGNVGIGTWTPQALLDISTGGGAGPLFLLSAAPSSEYIQNDLEVDGTAYLVEATIGSLSVTEGVTLTSGTTTGNVGIGTALANSNLSVNGTVGIGTGNASAYMGITGPSGGLIVQNNVGIGTFNPFGGNLIVNGGGNVGISSLTPGQKLDVVGTVRMTGFALTTSPTSGYVLTSDTNGNGSWQAAAMMGTNYWLNDTGNVGIGTIYNVGIGTISQVNSLNVLGNIGIGTFSYDPYMKTQAPNGGLIVAGNVGIGTWIPAAALQVGNSNSNTAASGINFGATNVDLYKDGNGYLATDASLNVKGTNIINTNGNIDILPNYNAELVLQPIGGDSWVPGAGTFDFTTITVNGASFVAGNIVTELQLSGTYTGGTTFTGSWTGLNVNDTFGAGSNDIYNGSSPIEALSITPTINVKTTSTSGYTALFVNPTETTISATANNYLADFQTGGADKFNVTDSGNVGIGTFNPFGGKLIIPSGNVGIGSLSPGQVLDVVGSARMTGFALTTSYSNGYVLTSDASGNGTWKAAAAAGTNYWLNDSGNVGINTTYNVGIGTSSQINALNIVGNIGIGTFSYDPYMLQSAPNGGLVVSGNVGIGTWAPSDLLQVGKFKSSVSGLEVDTNGNVGMGTTLTTTASLSVMSGNVGIGTWVPAQNLDVEGTGFFHGTTEVEATSAGSNALQILTYDTYHTTNLSYDGSSNFEISNGYHTIELGNSPISNLFLTSGDSIVTINSNLGIGTSLSQNGLDVATSGVSIGTSYAGYKAAPSNGMIVQGNVGINTTAVNSNLVVNGAVGIGTGNASAYMGIAAPSGGLIVQNNVGIGTFNPFGGKLIVSGGNVGIGSLSPGQVLDVVGTARMTGFALTTSYSNGYVLTSDGSGNGTWAAATGGGGGSNYWLNDSGNVGINTTYNVGIGTSSQINALNIVGNIGIGTFSYDPYMLKSAPNGGLVVSGNVGIGTWAPNSGLQLKTSFSVYRIGGSTGGNTAGQTIIGVNTSSARTVTLATADTIAGRVIIIKDETGSAGTYNILVNCQSTQTIDGASSISITVNYGVLRVYSDGSNWFTF